MRPMSRNLIDLTDHRFGRWVVLHYAGNDGNNSKWTCKCECGTVRDVYAHDLRNGGSKGCKKCQNSHHRQYIKKNDRYGRLVCTAPGPEYSEFRCDCGKKTTKRNRYVLEGGTRSCGCLRREQCRINASKSHEAARNRRLSVE